ncbi:Rieske 2Fe-2S domain-containing protein [Diaphorobacter caeni]|uniref:Rieske 2Fe-2S domain-containing protein n=1 Tax=Diaphorobacter caeni TaxID=2784387 RepID=UPI00188E285A|nr:Rieske 2Fe-2S domain-containing protein [Diaphorobacter caeni]MBF5007115.1 Rieske 2Fe-2S domain-containing protein [Diaphorobacter caeni]
MDEKSDKPSMGAAPKKIIPYGGYFLNKVPDPDMELTAVGPGTPMGEYMRRFWTPVCMVAELTDTPLFVRILGEDLVAFRDKSGRVGVLHAHCAHRGTSLEYGSIQERGIRCCYHGMVWDIDGTCIEVPFPKGEEKDAEKYACTVRQGAYRAVEYHGLVFAYMGDPEKEPPFPKWEENFTVAPGDELVPYTNWQHCNWLQVQDNAADNFHTAALHAAKYVVDGRFQETTFNETSYGALEVAPDMHFVPVHGGRGLACFGARRVNPDRIFVRVQHQVLPNISLHAYVHEDGSERKVFGRLNIVRWTVPVDDVNSKMIGWQIMGPGIDVRSKQRRELVGYESIDFLDGQVAMRRPERFGKYKLEDLPPIPSNHRERAAYKDAQYAPGDYEAIISQRPIAVHALEHPTKFDSGVYIFRKMLRDGLRGANPPASADGFLQWFQTEGGAPNSFCSDYVLDIPEGKTIEEEVERRRHLTKRIAEILTESDALKGQARDVFVKQRVSELERSMQAA